MITNPLKVAILLATASLSAPFQFSRSHLHIGIFGGLSEGLKMATPANNSVETDTDSGEIMDTEDELKLTKSKLKVLEHVVKKMKKNSYASSAAWEKRLAQEKEKNVKTLDELELIKKKQTSAESEFAEERKRHEKQIKTLTSDFEASIELSAKKVSDLAKRETSYKRDLKDSKAKMIQMEKTMAEMAEDHRNFEDSWKRETSRYESILGDRRLKEEELLAELDDVYAERDEAIAKLEETQQRQIVYVEAMERVKSSVAASEERESLLQGKYAALQTEYAETQREMQHLREKLNEVGEDNRILQEVAQSKAVDTGLQEELETLRKAILELRMQHNSQLKKQQRDAEKEIAKMRDDHYKQVQQLRKAVMERNDVTESKGPWQRIRKLFRRS